NSADALFPNQFVNCRLLLETKHHVVIVPAAAIQRGPSGSYVYVVGPDNKAVMRQVTVGTTEGNDVQVTTNLKGGDQVGIDGQDKLQEGSLVQTQSGGDRKGGSGSKKQ